MVTAEKGDEEIFFTLGEREIHAVDENGAINTVSMDAESRMIGSHIYVPIRYLAEAMGYSDITWDGETMEVQIKG